MREQLEATFLGTGTSSGVPLIGCDCAVCRSGDPRDRRRRTSLYLRAGGTHLLVDTPPDFREQALAYRLPRVDAVLFTHAHADHIFGLDDIRRFNTLQGGVIPAFAGAATLGEIRRVFNYIGLESTPDSYRPQLDFREIPDPFRIGEVGITPLPVEHGPNPTDGFLFTFNGMRLAYVPDCKRMPSRTLDRIRGVDVMVLDALRDRPHATHMTIRECLGCLARIGARQSYLVHMGHDLSHAELGKRMPPGVTPAHDGLRIRLPQD